MESLILKRAKAIKTSELQQKVAISVGLNIPYSAVNLSVDNRVLYFGAPLVSSDGVNGNGASESRTMLVNKKQAQVLISTGVAKDRSDC